MPPAPTTPPSPLSRPGTAKSAPTTPLPPVDRIHLAPLTTWESFVVIHQAAHRQREDYLHPGFRRRPSLDRATRADMQPRRAFLLPANNMAARIRYARIMAEALERHALTLGPDVPLFFVTLIDRRHTVQRRHGAAFAEERVIGWAHEILRGASYVGMVEAAYYSNLRTLPGPARRYLSWHCHLVLWGLTEAEVEALCAAINARFTTAIPGCTAAHYRPLPLEEVFGQGLYMCKGQINEYRVWRKKKKVVDRFTGRKVWVLTREWESKKRPLRPADAIHLCRAFAGRLIDRLAFVAGDGRVVLRAVNRSALAEFTRWEARQPYARAETRRRAAG